MAMTPKGWSISALAVELGRDRRTIAAAVAGLAPMERTGKASLYRLTDVLPMLMGSGKPTDFDDAKARKMSAEAELAEHELARVRSETVPIGDTVTVVGEAFTAARAKWLAVPSKYGPIMAPAMTEAESRTLLDRCVREVLNELVADATSRAEGGDLSNDGGDAEAPTDPDGERVGGLLSQAFL